MELNEVIPISVTRPDWQIYTDTLQELLKINPRKALDAEEIALTDMKAFLLTLGLDGKINKSQNPYNKGNKHVFISFLTVIDEETILELLSYNLVFIHKERKKDFVVLMTGSLSQWHDACVVGCDNPITRIVFNNVVKCLEQIGFKIIFYNYKKVYEHEGFVLSWSKN